MKKSLLYSFFITALLCIAGINNVWADVTYTLSSGTLTFSYSGSGSSAMTDYADFDGSGSPKRPAAWTFSVTHVVINEGVTTIGTNVFQGCSSLQDISIPTSVTTCKAGAFTDCSSMARIYYAGSPNQWAVIDFANETAHPFGALSSSADYYFYDNKSNKTNTLVFFPPLTEIKKYTFYRIYLSDGLSIPGTVASIGNYAFYGCNIQGQMTINRKASPTMGTDAFRGIGTNRTLYVPSGATGYRTSGSNWYFSLTTQAVKGNSLESYGSNIKWELEEDGTLTIDATGDGAATTITYSGSAQYHWTKFRRLVNKIVLKGEITGVNRLFDWHYGIQEIDLDQATIPTIQKIASNSTNSYDNLFNPNGKVAVKVRQETLMDATEMAKLNNAAWNYGGHLQKGLVGAAVYSDGQNNSALVTALGSLDLPFSLQLNRTLIVDGEQYNTFCSPIALTAAQLNDADIRALESSSLDGEDLTLTFSASSLEGIEAGKPYLVRPTTEVANPTFTNIAPNSLVSTTTNTETEYVDFIGVLAPTLLTGGDKNTLFLGADNELLWPEADANIKGMRAYFSVKGDAQQAAKRARIVMNKDAATGLQNTEHRTQTQKILRDGQIIIIRDGKEYNVQGQMIK